MYEGKWSETGPHDGLDEAVELLVNKMHFTWKSWTGKEVVSCFLLVTGMD